MRFRRNNNNCIINFRIWNFSKYVTSCVPGERQDVIVFIGWRLTLRGISNYCTPKSKVTGYYSTRNLCVVAH